jgi:hypothetical protein
MIKTQIIGHLAHDNKLFSKTCDQCGGIYTDQGTPSCPTCNKILVPITAKNGRAMMVSEGTIYPIMTQSEKDREVAARAKRRNSMEATYRFVLLSFAHPETGIVTEPPIHKYLVKGRQIMIEVNHVPIISWFTAKDESTKCELRLTVISNEGDSIKLLGKKESMENLTIEEKASVDITQVTQPKVTPKDDFATRLALLQTQLGDLITEHSQGQPGLVKEAVVASGEPIVIKNNEDDPFF